MFEFPSSESFFSV